LIPNVLKSITSDVSNTNGATSQEVSWSVAEETEDQPWIIFAMLLAVVLAGAWVVSNQATKAALRTTKEEVEESDSMEKSYLEDDEVETEEESEDNASDEDSSDRENVWDSASED
jgi:flagellar biosynthesis/type III secretory pathway M-ring protein FliF/YscJ